MQNKEMKSAEFILLSVPAEMLEEANIYEGMPIQCSVKKGRLIVEPVGLDSGLVCDGVCEDCPMSEIDCDGNCENCPCFDGCDESEVRQ